MTGLLAVSVDRQNTAVKSSRIKTEDLDSTLASCSASVTDSSAVSMKRFVLKLDCSSSSSLFRDRNKDTWLKTVFL